MKSPWNNPEDFFLYPTYTEPQKKMTNHEPCAIFLGYANFRWRLCCNVRFHSRPQERFQLINICNNGAPRESANGGAQQRSLIRLYVHARIA